jgi:hypothetical protein
MIRLQEKAVSTAFDTYRHWSIRLQKQAFLAWRHVANETKAAEILRVDAFKEQFRSLAKGMLKK